MATINDIPTWDSMTIEQKKDRCAIQQRIPNQIVQECRSRLQRKEVWNNHECRMDNERRLGDAEAEVIYWEDQKMNLAAEENYAMARLGIQGRKIFAAKKAASGTR